MGEHGGGAAMIRVRYHRDYINQILET